jgi:tRNA A-37 threonylcarbamoyl transferase component Bud32
VNADPLTRADSLSTSPGDSLDAAGACEGEVRTELLAGDLLGQFRVEGRIGRGGRGIVYRAYDVKLKRQVALKVLADGAARVDRLLAEARSAAALTHAAIAAVYDVQQVGEVAFLVMELVEGVTLRQTLSQGPLPLDRALVVARDVAAAMARAHRCGIVHRDLKPENVVVTPEGRAKVLDFGLARPMDEASASASEHVVAGTRNYMSPEQAAGRFTDAHTDVFSFGIFLHEILAGVRPFPCAEPEETRQRPEAWSRARKLRELAPKVPPALERVVDRCLQLEPDRRFADGIELEAALDAFRPSARPRRAVLVAAAAAVLAATTTAAWAIHAASAHHVVAQPAQRVAPPRQRLAAAGQTWELLDGDWSVDGDDLLGRAGHVQTTQDVADAVVTVEVELPDTPRTMVGIGFRYTLREDNPLLQCGYGFNFSPRKISGAFAGEDGEWGPVASGFEPSTVLRSGWNEITVRMKGASFEVDVNGQRADAFQDAHWSRGHVNFWVLNGEVRFRNVRITP